jgi:HSP20 family protein
MIYRSLYGVPAWGGRSPFHELDRMQRQMDRLFDAFGGPRDNYASAGVFPPINLSEDKESFFVRAELPGIAADKLEIQATGNSLALSGERRIDEEGQDVRYHRREREGGTFSRVITLPGDIDAEKVDAKLVNGILTIKIAKAEEAKPKQISVRH